MGRDRTRVLICAAASLALIVAGTLIMDWYRVSFDALDAVGAGASRLAIDLRSLRVCRAASTCADMSLSPLPGMFPTLATVTLWSSLGFGGLVAFQAGARILTGNANDSLTKLGYMFALMAISIAVATAYMFGPETEGPDLGFAGQLAGVLHRTWAPLILLIGLVAGFVTLYMAVSPDLGDLGAEYKPVTLPNLRAVPDSRPRSSPVPLLVHDPTATQLPSIGRGPTRPMRGMTRPPTELSTTVTATASITASGAGAPPTARPQSGPIPAVPEHLRNRLHYVALTAELSGGGIDARREDGSSRLVLWRDVVGVVARRLPPAYDSATFIDIVSTAGSTLRIVPWTRLTGEPIELEGEARPRGIIERVVARCPGAKLDPATRQFLDRGEAAQLPNLETLRAHDDRLA